MVYYVLNTLEIKQKVISLIMDAPEFFAITIDLKKRSRSEQQNKFMWAVPYKMIADYDGRTPEYVHAKYASEGLGFDIHVVDGEKYFCPYSTKKLTTVEFMDYMNFIKEKAYRDHGLVIPDPNQYGLE